MLTPHGFYQSFELASFAFHHSKKDMCFPFIGNRLMTSPNKATCSLVIFGIAKISLLSVFTTIIFFC